MHLFNSLAKVAATGMAVVIATLMAACAGEDRSGEQPFAPSGVTAAVAVRGDTCFFQGHVSSSPNSTLTACGFYWGNDTLRNRITVDSAAYDFAAEADSVAGGVYYLVAYATNGIGTTRSDTVYFIVEREGFHFR